MYKFLANQKGAWLLRGSVRRGVISLGGVTLHPDVCVKLFRTSSGNSYMEALFTSVDETSKPLRAEVKGEIPDWLRGSLLRVGPGQFEVGSQKYNHLFDGLSLIHRFNIEGSKVTYQNRFLRSDSYVLAKQKNRIVVSEFGTSSYPDPCMSIFSRFFSYFKLLETDNCNVNLMQVRDEVYAMTETPVIRRVDPKTLDTYEKKVDRSKHVALNLMTAHPHTDTDGTMYNMASRFGRDGIYGLVKIPLPDEGERNNPLQKAYMIGSIPQRSTLKPSYHHSFGLTKNYVVFIEQPMYFNVLDLMTAKLTSNTTAAAAMEFDHKIPVRFHVIDKATGKVLPTTYLADAFFTFHHINAYEEDGQLVVDVCCDEHGAGIKYLYLDNLMGRQNLPMSVQARRYVIPLQPEKGTEEENLVTLPDTQASAVFRKDGTVFCTPETLCPGMVELPRINYDHYNGKKYQFFYGISGQNKVKLVKADIHTKSVRMWKEPGCWPSEPVFVPAPGADSEDKGVVLSLVVKSLDEDRSVFLLVLDGETFTEVARADVPSPAEAAMTFHGIFLSDM